MANAKRRVLVVEDDESMREAVDRLLALAGFETAAYASAESLLAEGAGEAASCIVSDLRLPAMSGLELLAALRARGARTAFVLITAYDEPGLAERAKEIGATAYLVKPFHGTALLAAVRSTMPAGAP